MRQRCVGGLRGKMRGSGGDGTKMTLGKNVRRDLRIVDDESIKIFQFFRHVPSVFHSQTRNPDQLPNVNDQKREASDQLHFRILVRAGVARVDKVRRTGGLAQASREPRHLVEGNE